MSEREWKEGDVLGTVTLYIESVNDSDYGYPFVVSFKETDELESNAMSYDELSSLMEDLNPSLKVERIKQEIADKQKELEELEKGNG